MVEACFGRIPAGERCQTPAGVPSALPGAPATVRVKPLQPGAQPFAAVSLRAPVPSDAGYPAFLLLVQRLASSGAKLSAMPGHFPVNYAVLNDPENLTISVPLQPGESAEKAVARVNAFIDEWAGRALGPAEIQSARAMYGVFLGMVGPPASAEPYSVAFSVGRRLQLGLDGAQLSMAMDRITAEDLEKARGEYFAAEKRATVVVIPE